MLKNPLFKFNVTKLSASEIKIDTYDKVDNDLYSHTHVILSLSTLPEFISRLSDKQAIGELDILPVIDNGIDKVEFKYSGSDREPFLTVVVDHKLANGDIDEGIIDIPLDFLGREEENMKYITLIVVELKKYIP